MLTISRLRNPIQTYAWGSRTGIADFLGWPPADEPQAELWMGAHPKAPSDVEVDGRWRSLAEVVDEHPREVLGDAVLARHGQTLPFLFKVLAASRALSIQAHPDRAQAVAGCRREDHLGISRRAPERNYRDSNHKPEVILAVTPFVILRGFREPADILERMRHLDLPELLPVACRALGADNLEGFFSDYMRLDPERLDAVRLRALAGVDAAGGGEVDHWVAKLERQFPGDRGILAPLFLHLEELTPGEAIFTGPGVLHAYLEGVGIELMANSDNVVRGGLTSKHVDVEELLRILRFEPQPPRLLGSTVTGGGRRLETVAGEFDLSVVDVAPGNGHRAEGGSVEILLCSRGRGTVRSGKVELTFAQGDALLVPAVAGSYRLEGDATLYRAGVPAAE